jgi:hypothetical protein
MTPRKNLTINFALNSLIFYVLGRKLRGHQTGLRLGLIGGALSGFVVWYIDAQSDGTDD